MFADYLCGLERPYLKYDVLNSCYKPLVSVASQQQQPEMEEVTSRKHRLGTNRSISTSSNCTVGSNTEFDHGQTGLESMSELSLDDELIELKGTLNNNPKKVYQDNIKIFKKFSRKKAPVKTQNGGSRKA